MVLILEYIYIRQILYKLKYDRYIRQKMSENINLLFMVDVIEIFYLKFSFREGICTLRLK